MKKKKKEWGKMKVKRKVWRLIKEGMWLMWKGEIPRFEKRNRVMKEDEMKVVEEEIENWKKQGVVKGVKEEEGQCVSPFAIGEREGEKRAVIDFTEINKYIKIPIFRQEALRQSKEIIRRGDWMVKIDFKRAFHAIAIDERFRKYLRVRWREELLEFQAMPLGLATSPYFFNMLMVEMAAEIRRKGVRLIYYVDDWVILGRTKTEAERSARVAITTMSRLGMTINKKKSKKEATQREVFLGVELDVEENKMRIPKEKARGLKRAVEKMKGKEEVTVREAMRIVGKMSWAVFAWRCLKRELTRMHWWVKEKLKKVGWDKKVRVDQRMRKILERILRVPMKKEEREVTLVKEEPKMTIITDAGPRGGAAVVKVEKKEWIFLWKWNKGERMMSSNWRELKVMERVLRVVRKWVKEEQIRWITDSVVAEAYVRKAIGKQKALAKMAWKIRKWEVERKIEIQTKVVKGERISHVDKLSRIVDLEDYQLKNKSYTAVKRRMGIPKIDLFATRFSTKEERFVSREYDPIAVETDALTISWRGLGLLYAFPPTYLIPKVLQKVADEKVEMILITPATKKARWSATLEEMTKDEMKLGRAVRKEEREKVESIYYKASKISGLK